MTGRHPRSSVHVCLDRLAWNRFLNDGEYVIRLQRLAGVFEVVQRNAVTEVYHALVAVAQQVVARGQLVAERDVVQELLLLGRRDLLR